MNDIAFDLFAPTIVQRKHTDWKMFCCSWTECDEATSQTRLLSNCNVLQVHGTRHKDALILMGNLPEALKLYLVVRTVFFSGDV